MSDLYLEPSRNYEEPLPCGNKNLIKVYDLENIAASVARTDPVTGAKKKLRKSYKGHIVDLPGKNEIPTEHYLLRLIYAPDAQNPISVDKPMDSHLLENVFTMDKTPDSGVAGFDATLLGIAPIVKKEKGGATTVGESSAGEDRSRRRSKRKSGQDEDETGRKRRRG
ncbi:Rox3 mediator complex subunit-domain-containing protein [Dipodascopsis uninucleata]